MQLQKSALLADYEEEFYQMRFLHAHGILLFFFGYWHVYGVYFPIPYNFLNKISLTIRRKNCILAFETTSVINKRSLDSLKICNFLFSLIAQKEQICKTTRRKVPRIQLLNSSKTRATIPNRTTTLQHLSQNYYHKIVTRFWSGVTGLEAPKQQTSTFINFYPMHKTCQLPPYLKAEYIPLNGSPVCVSLASLPPYKHVPYNPQKNTFCAFTTEIKHKITFFNSAFGGGGS